MQNWEYCFVYIPPYTHGAPPCWRRLSPSGTQGEDLRRDKSLGDKNDGSAAFRYMATLGESGWEMVWIAVSTPGSEASYWFKRPLA